jgi:beta-glucosidase
VIKDFPVEMVGYAEGYHRTGAPDSALENEAVALAKKADVVLLYVGLDEIAESEGLDRPNMKMSATQIQLMEKVAAANSHVVAVLSAGSSIEMPWIDKCEAVIHGYLSGQAGAKAMLNAITGKVNPSGKLNETYPFAYEDTPSSPYFPSKERNAEYREGLYVGYRYFETVQKPVRFPFGFGLSYTTFAYSDLTVSQKEVTFTLANTGKVDGAEIAQVYVSAKGGKVYRPAKELKGFAKIFLKAGESKTVTIALDDKAFRYFNEKTNRFEIDGGTYEIQVGASCADIKLKGAILVKGTDAPAPVDTDKIPSYMSGDILNVSDQEFTTLLGHAIPDGHWSGQLEMNDAICQLYYAKRWIGRLVYRIMTNMLNKSIEKGKPDLNIMFIYNMPFRGIGKMTGGMVSQYMVEGMVKAVNGHFFKGLGQIISGFFKQKKVLDKANKME